MDIGQSCCILCFQIIEFKKNLHPSHKYYDKDYKKTLFDCCNRLLGVEIDSLNCRYSLTNSSPFCLTCFQSTEELWQKEGKPDNKKALNSCVETFTGNILQSRLKALSQKFNSEENTIEDDNLEENLDDPISDQLDEIAEWTTAGPEIKLEIVKEEADFIEEIFVNKYEPFDCDENVDDLSTFEILPTAAENLCSFEKPKNTNNLTESKSNSSYPELRVLLERLKFDNKGNVVIPLHTGKGVRNEKQGMTAGKLFSSSIKNSSPDRRCRRTKTEALRYRDNDEDSDFECGDDDSESENSENGQDRIAFGNSMRKRKIRSRRRKRSSSNDTISEDNTDKTEKRFSCAVCPSVFGFARQLDKHSKKSGHVNERTFKCTECPAAFYRTLDLHWHKTKHNFRTRKCEYCDNVFGNRSAYYIHVKSHNEWKNDVQTRVKKRRVNFQCVVCLAEFTVIRKFNKHLKETGHVNIPTVQCPKCAKKLYNDRDLKDHDSNVHDAFTKTCPTCNEEIFGRFKYWHHLKRCKVTVEPEKSQTSTYLENTSDAIKKDLAHKNEKQYKCDKCNASFKILKELTQHQAGHLIETNVQCHICFCFCKNENGLKTHTRRTHNKQDKKIDCNLCDKTFKVFRHLIAHQITDHEMQSPFFCRHCKMTFKYKIHLKIHLRNAHKDKQPYEQPGYRGSCDFCGKGYKNKPSLFLHLFTHTNFSMKLVKKHIKIVSRKEGIFQCEECGKIFRSDFGLNKHWTRQHSDTREEGNFPCQVCSKMFSFKCAMERHVRRVHTGPAICDICGNGFGSEECLRRHKKRIHEQNRTHRRNVTSRTFNRELQNNLSKHSITETLQPTVTAQPGIVGNEIQNADIDKFQSIPGKDNIKTSTITLNTTENIPSQSLLKEKPAGDYFNLKENNQSEELRFCTIQKSDNTKPNGTGDTNVEQCSEILKDIIDSSKVTTENDSLKSIQHSGATNTEPTIAELYNENTFDDTYFEDAAADYPDSDNNTNDVPISTNYDKDLSISTDQANVGPISTDHSNNVPISTDHSDVVPFSTDHSNNVPIATEHPIKEEVLFEDETSNEIDSFHESQDTLPATAFRELRVLLERLQFDSKGNVIKPVCTSTVLRKRRAAILAESYLAVDDDEESLTGDKVERNDDDKDFVGQDLSTDSDDSEKNDEDWKKSNNSPFRDRERTGLRRKYQLGSGYHQRKLKRRKTQPMFSKFKCSECLLMFNTEREFQGHLDVTGHVSLPSYECQKCNECFHRRQDLRIHEKGYHGLENITNPENPFKCDKCKATFESEKILLSHKEGHLVQTNVQCDICYLFYKNENSLRVHYVTIHKLKYNTKKSADCRRKGRLRNPVISNEQMLSKKYKCTVCLLIFKARKEFDGHLKETGHASIPLLCEKCNKCFHRRQDLRIHEKVYHKMESKEKPFKCDKCKAAFSQERRLLLHKEDHLVEKNLQCDICYLFYKNENSLRVHKFTDHQLRYAGRRRKPSDKKQVRAMATKFKCTECELIFNFRKEFQNHLKEAGHVSNPSFECQKCKKLFHRLYDLTNHERGVHDLESLTCTLCNEKFMGTWRFKAHLRIHQTNSRKDYPFKCDQCNARLSTEVKLHAHQNDHLVETNVQCDICFYFYKNINSLRAHRFSDHKIDDMERQRRKFACGLCGKNHHDLVNYIAHQISEHGMKSPFTCKHCPDSFSYRKELKIHLKSIHNETMDDNSPESCRFCGKEYKTPFTVLKHTLGHLNVSEDILNTVQSVYDGLNSKGSFQCEDCGRMFTYKDSLKLHWNRYHAPDAKSRNITCNICGKILHDAKAVRKHMIIHNKKFQCEMCERKFSMISSLQGHVKRIHEQNKTPRKPYTRTPFPKNKI